MNGDRIAQDLTTIFAQAGPPQAILKDGDATLQQGVSQWMERHALTLPVIDDLGHAMARA